MRTKEFSVIAAVRNDFSDSLRAGILDAARGVLVHPLIGPRGGTYLPFGDITEDSTADYGDAWIRNETTHRFRRMARYVRPHLPLQDSTTPERNISAPAMTREAPTPARGP